VANRSDKPNQGDSDRRDRVQHERLVRRARVRSRRDLRSPRDFAENVETIDRVADRVANDVNALVRAWSAANAESFKGAVTILGNVALDLFGGATRASRRGDEAYRDDLDREDEYAERDPDRAPAPYATRRSNADRIEEAGDEVAGFTHAVSDALAGAASVVSRASRRFQDEYDNALDDAEDADRDLGREDTDPRDHDDGTAPDESLGAPGDDADRVGDRPPPAGPPSTRKRRL